MSKSIAVFGATGEQGSSVVNTMLANGWKVTGFTRDPSSSSAQALASRGVNVVKGDFNDPSTYKEALKGQDAAFVNADFWAVYMKNGYNAENAKEVEITHAKNAIQAAVDAGVKHIVYTTLEGGLGCVQWDSKAEVTAWTKENNLPVTNLYTSAYFSNIPKYQLVKPNDDGTFSVSFPAPDSCKFPSIPIGQTGEWVYAALENPEKWKGKDMFMKLDTPTVAQVAEILSKISGKTVKSGNMPEQYFLSDDFKNTVGPEVWKNWKVFYDGNPKRDPSVSEGVIPNPLDFESWAKQNKWLKETLGF